MKPCTKCDETKPLDEYHRDRTTGDGRASKCRSCVAAYSAANSEKRRASSAAWYAANRERASVRAAEYIETNRHKAWEGNYRQRARAFGFEPVVSSFTHADMIAYWGNGQRCIYCEAPATEIEHLIPVGLGGHHVIENVAPSCGPCNRVNINTVRRERRAMAAA